jgi:hypothetical protein
MWPILACNGEIRCILPTPLVRNLRKSRSLTHILSAGNCARTCRCGEECRSVIRYHFETAETPVSTILIKSALSEGYWTRPQATAPAALQVPFSFRAGRISMIRTAAKNAGHIVRPHCSPGSLVLSDGWLFPQSFLRTSTVAQPFLNEHSETKDWPSRTSAKPSTSHSVASSANCTLQHMRCRPTLWP